MIPKHVPCLPASDYTPYLAAGLRSGRDRQLSMPQVWGGLFHRQGLFPTPTGRYALWYFLELLDLQPGDEVLVGAYNFYVIVRLLLQKGLTPVFVDIDPETLGMNAEDLARKITPRSRLVIVTHMFGHPANLAAISALCQAKQLLLFEDCAHGVGTLAQKTTGDVEQVGQAGDGALFSFGIEKLVTSFGGGMLVLADALAARYQPPAHNVPGLLSFRDTFSRALIACFMHPRLYGASIHRIATFGDRRLPALQHIIAPAKDNPDYRFVANSRAPFKPFMLRMHQQQLARLPENVNRRRAIVQSIKARLPSIDEIGLLQEDKHGRSNGAYFGLYVPDPLALAHYLAAHGIDSNPQEYYDCTTLTQFAPYAATCEHANYASHHLLRLPSYPWLQDREVDHIATTIAAFFAGK